MGIENNALNRASASVIACSAWDSVLIYRGFCASFQTAFRGLRVRNAFIVDTGVHTAADSGFNYYFTVRRNCSIFPRGWFRESGALLRSHGDGHRTGRRFAFDQRTSLAVRLGWCSSNRQPAREPTRTQ